jgi:4-carboxymuconolactone decarboxylase
VEIALTHIVCPLSEIGSCGCIRCGHFLAIVVVCQALPVFRGAGVPPAIFVALTHHKTAGGTPALQHQFDIWNSAHIMPQDFSKRSRGYPEQVDEERVKSMDEVNEPKNSDVKSLVDRRDFLGGATVLAGTSLLGLASAAGAEAAEGVADRMPPIPSDKWTDAQKKAAEEITSGPRKELVGPFIPLLRSPEFMSRLQKVGEYLRFNTKLGSNISEFIILIIARQWTQQFEWYSHESLALKAGVKEDTIKSIAEGQRPAAMTPDEEMIYDYISELRLHQSVSDPAYAKVINRFGEQGVIDITGLCGYYTLLGMLMNVTRTPLPPGKTPPLATFPH